MERKFPHLSSPIQIGNVVFRNRMCSAPMGGTDITNEGAIGPGSKAFYELRAKGGAAAVTVSECMVHPQTDGSQAYHLDLSIPESLPSFTYAADAQFVVMERFPVWSFPIPVCTRVLIWRIRTRREASVSGALPMEPAPTVFR